MKKQLHAELTRSDSGQALAILNGFPGGHDATMNAQQLRALASCLVKVAEALDAGASGEIEQVYSCDY